MRAPCIFPVARLTALLVLIVASLSATAQGPKPPAAPVDGADVSTPAPLPEQARTPANYSLTLQQLFDAALASHPSLQAARLQARASAQDVTATERQRWPTISVIAETDTGTTASSASRALRVEQTLWDAGRNTSRIDEAQTRVRIARAQVYLQQQELFIQIINAWQNLVGATERRNAAVSTLERLKAYQQQMERRVAAQASPRIDLELADARVLQTEVELTTANTSLQVATTRLEQLTSLTGLSTRLAHLPPVPAAEGTQTFLRVLQETDWPLIASLSAVVDKARMERQLISNQLTTKQAEQWPQVYLRWDKPLETTQTNSVTQPSIFAGLRYTPGAGFASLAEAASIATRMESQDYAVEAALRDVQQTLQSDMEEFINARSRMQALERSVDGSRLVLDSYVRQFQAGRKSWQDLLNSARDLAQNQYSLADARASLVGALHRLQLRMDRSPELP